MPDIANLVDEQETLTDEGGSCTWCWFAAGVAIGAAVGMLWAPKSGKDTRDFLTSKTQQGKDAMASSGKDVLEAGKEFYDKGRQIVEDAAALFERGRKLVRGE